MPVAERQQETGTGRWLLCRRSRITGRIEMAVSTRKGADAGLVSLRGIDVRTPEPKDKLDTDERICPRDGVGGP
ncbi:hypothetical protein Acor_80920 [Acrocarpospora corrugata]|uniref:Uncharacterized protein n=1 Tax=Acrocarpospora corrugata TaxID=35763 RepID=A0A5M3WFV3_9ACTN|nr:hypothetical protein Acor_80920 [Acrocarpospora corrugata]